MSSEDLPDLPRAKGPAASLDEARPGNMLLVDRTGQVVSSRSWPIIASGLKMFAVFSGASLISIWLAVALFGPGAAFAGSILPLVGAFVWIGSQAQLGTALQRLGSGDLAGAEELAHRVATRRWTSAFVRGNALFIAASAMWLRGDRRGALETNRSAMAMFARSISPSSPLLALLAAFNDIQLTAILGDPAKARVDLEALERRGKITAGDLVQIQHVDTCLVLAFETDDTSMLPDDLGPWTRQVLATHRFGSTLVLLAWAHHRRGEPEMPEALLEVARDRLPECHIEHAHPRLSAWYGSVASAAAVDLP